MADIRIFGEGFFTIHAENQTGEEWMRDNVVGAEAGEAHSDDINLTQSIAQGATEAGLVVAVNGHLYLDGGRRGEAI